MPVGQDHGLGSARGAGNAAQEVLERAGELGIAAGLEQRFAVGAGGREPQAAAADRPYARVREPIAELLLQDRLAARPYVLPSCRIDVDLRLDEEDVAGHLEDRVHELDVGAHDR